MIVLVLLVAAAAFLGVGVGADSSVLDSVAVGLSGVAVILVLGSWAWPLLTRPRAVEPAESAAPEAEPAALPVRIQDASPVAVVFVPGRTTFHAPECTSVQGKASSRGVRADLEAGGMTACKRCMTA